VDDARRKTGSLDPGLDPDRWEARVHSIVAAARPELGRLAGARPMLPLLTLVDWARPLVATAAIIAAIAVASLLTTPSGGASQAETVGSIAEAITPEPVAAWLLVGVVPTTEELIGAIHGGQQ
jgi:hypothetical protein